MKKNNECFFVIDTLPNKSQTNPKKTYLKQQQQNNIYLI